MDKMKNILTNPKDMDDFIKMVKKGLEQTQMQKLQLKNQLQEVNNIMNTHQNTLELLQNWQQIMAKDDLTLIKMAYDDIKRTMTDIKTV